MAVLVIYGWIINAILALLSVQLCADVWLLILRRKIDRQQKEIDRKLSEIAAAQKGGDA